MKIKPPTTAGTDPKRLLECQDALQRHVDAVLEMADKAPAHATVPEYRQIVEAARKAGWDDAAIHAAIDMLVIRHFETKGEAAKAAAIRTSRPYRLH